MSQTPDTALVAEPERRFQAFVIDRVLAWGLFAASGFAAWWWFFREGEAGAGAALVAGTVIVVSAMFVLLLGIKGTSPGKALLGLRVVSHDGGTPIGIPRALLRTLVLGAASVPMFGLGVATLAWTAVDDRSGQRRGWHDHVAGSVVLDVRPRPVAEVEHDERPRHVVNLTAMKLVPVRQPVGPAVPVATGPGPTTADQPEPEPVAAPRPAPHEPDPAPSAPRPPVPAPQSTVPQPPGDRPQQQVAQQPPRDSTVVGSRASQQPPRPAGAPRRAIRWRVTFDTGETFVVEGLGVVGRAPTGRPGEPVRHVVPLRSDDMSISKTHAQFHLASDGALVVMDRGSTNGSLLVRKGVSRELAAGRPATLVDGDRVVLGDRQMKVSRES